MRIEKILTKEQYTIAPPVFCIGRHTSCDLVLSNRWVSLLHAVLRRVGRTWQVRDLGTTNGTFIDGVRIQKPHTLIAGMALAFGDPTQDMFRVIDVRPPTAKARSADGAIATAQGSFLCIPGPQDWEYMVFPDSAGGWLVETASGERWPVSGHSELRCKEQVWALELPPLLESTQALRQWRFTCSGATMRFLRYGDGQTVDIELVQGDERERWESRIHHAMLLRLAQERLRDQRQGLSSDNQGWMYVDEVQEYFEHSLGLPLSLNTLNQYVFRARRECQKADMRDAADVIERRHEPKKIRLGIGTIEIVRL